MSIPQLEEVIAKFKQRVENALSIEIENADIDIWMCNGYLSLSYEDDENTVNAEISECANQFILTGFEITD